MPGEGIEPPTFGLQNRCTTAVLTRRDGSHTPPYMRGEAPNHAIPLGPVGDGERRTWTQL